MYKCDICGRELFKQIKAYGHVLCAKHYHQWHKYGRFLDNNPRSTHDLNDYSIKGDIAIFNVYNQKSIKVCEFIIDSEDVSKIKYYRWRVSYGRIVTGNNSKKHPTLYLTHLLLGVESTDYYNKIDHIDGDPLNNRKKNLRICTQGENTLNKSSVSNNTSGFIGVHPDNRKNRNSHWCAEIRRGNKKCSLGAYVYIEEAVYARYVAEIILFGEFRNKTHDDIKLQLFSKIDEQRKQEIESYVIHRIHTKCVLPIAN